MSLEIDGFGFYAPAFLRREDGGFELQGIIETDDPTSKLIVKSLNGNTIYRRGVDYSYDPEPEKYPADLRIRRLPGGDIQAGSTLILSYNYYLRTLVEYDLKGKTSWSDPTFFDEFENVLIKPTMDVFEPDYVIMIDEEHTHGNRDGRGRRRGLSNYQAWINYVNKKASLIKRNATSEVVVLHDDNMLNPWHWGQYNAVMSAYGYLWHGLEYLDRDITLMPYAYGISENDRIQMQNWYYKLHDINFLDIADSGCYSAEESNEACGVEDLRAKAYLDANYQRGYMAFPGGGGSIGMIGYTADISNERTDITNFWLDILFSLC